MTAGPDNHTARRLSWLERIQDDAEISAAAFGLAFAISRHLNRSRGDAWPSQRRLGKLAGVKERQVRNLLRQLVERGYLSIESGGFQRSDRYRPTFPNRQPIAASDRQSIAAAAWQSNDIHAGKHLPPNPLKEPLERIATLSADERKLANEIFAIMPKASTSRSNRDEVGRAVGAILATGVPSLSLKLAVTGFVRESPAAKDEDGRFMGAAHKWLTEKRGWEAFLPNADQLFLHDRPKEDASWLVRVRSWLRRDWTWKVDEYGPKPGAAGCRVPGDILEYCKASEPADDATRVPALELKEQRLA